MEGCSPQISTARINTRWRRPSARARALLEGACAEWPHRRAAHFARSPPGPKRCLAALAALAAPVCPHPPHPLARWARLPEAPARAPIRRATRLLLRPVPCASSFLFLLPCLCCFLFLCARPAQPSSPPCSRSRRSLTSAIPFNNHLRCAPPVLHIPFVCIYALSTHSPFSTTASLVQRAFLAPTADRSILLPRRRPASSPAVLQVNQQPRIAITTTILSGPRPRSE